MDQYNWLLAEILVEQRARQLDALSQHAPPQAPVRGANVRRALATAVVRLGLRLDPAAGERIALTLAHEGRQ